MRCFLIVSLILISFVATGCRGGWSHGGAKKDPFATTQPSPPALPTEKVAFEEPSKPEKSQEQTLEEVLGELTELGALEPAEKAQLEADLREANPDNWPLIAHQFRSALAFRKQLAEREQKAKADEPEASLAQVSDQPKVARTETMASLAKTTANTPQAIAVTPISQPGNEHLHGDADDKPLSQVVAQLHADVHDDVAMQTAEPSRPIMLSKPPQQLAQQASYNSAYKKSAYQTPQDWRNHLQTAIEDLQTTVQPSPGSTDEVNEHMRLRLLQLLAGNEELALQPIPGATAPQQDYWNKQLFAVSTFLDSQQQPDDMRRAAGSLMHLDQARAKLAELATLQVRQLALVESVEGYGAYQVHEETKFSPGATVTLYAEIENFSSESTPDGYRTRLGTSYEVVDKNGKRVDSDQFPEVEDTCLTPRRDFHMQYTVKLPTRIYPDQYQIRLIITDQQSHKIGQASVPFEIVE